MSDTKKIVLTPYLAQMMADAKPTRTDDGKAGDTFWCFDCDCQIDSPAAHGHLTHTTMALPPNLAARVARVQELEAHTILLRTESDARHVRIVEEQQKVQELEREREQLLAYRETARIEVERLGAAEAELEREVARLKAGRANDDDIEGPRDDFGFR